MAWPALDPGRLLERCGDVAPRRMTVHDRTRLTGRLRHLRSGVRPSRRCPRFIPPLAVQTAGPAPGMPHPCGCRRAPLTQGGLHSGALLERRVVCHRWNCCRWNCLVMTAALFSRLAEGTGGSRPFLPSTACGGGCPKGGWGQRGNAWRIPPSSGAGRPLLPRAGEGERSGLLPPGLREGEERSRRSLPSTACGGRCPKGGWGRRGDGVPIPSSGAARPLLPQEGEGGWAICICPAYGSDAWARPFVSRLIVPPRCSGVSKSPAGSRPGRCRSGRSAVRG